VGDDQARRARQRQARDGRSGFRGPPVVDHPRVRGGVLGQQVLEGSDDAGFASLPGQEQRSPGSEAASLADLVEPLVLRVVLADGAQGRRRGEEDVDLVPLDHAPERSRVGRAHGLALVQDRGGADQQWRIQDVRMPDHPTDIRGAKHDIPGSLDAEQIPDRETQPDRMSTGLAHHALR
jgi:hypothetical protein